MILALVSLTKASICLLHVLLYGYNTVLVHLCYEASSQIRKHTKTHFLALSRVVSDS